MTPLDASRLVIASAGSTFEGLGRCLDAVRKAGSDWPDSPYRDTGRKPGATDRGASDGYPATRVSPSPEWQQRFGSRRLAETALQLLDATPTNDKKIDRLPRFAILRWLDDRGHSAVVVFGPEETSIGRGTEISDLLDQYSDHCLFQVRQATGPDRHRESTAMTRSPLMVTRMVTLGNAVA
jgi:hypothetical protein